MRGNWQSSPIPSSWSWTRVTRLSAKVIRRLPWDTYLILHIKSNAQPCTVFDFIVVEEFASAIFCARIKTFSTCLWTNVICSRKMIWFAINRLFLNSRSQPDAFLQSLLCCTKDINHHINQKLYGF